MSSDLSQTEQPDSAATLKPITRRERISRSAAVVFIALYLAVNGFFLLRNCVRPAGPNPWVYFFTWDMYPFYRTVSSRPLAIGRTRSGEYRELLPSPMQQFRWGADGTATRTDLDHGFVHTRSSVERILESSTVSRDDSIVHVYLIEEYWPVRFNLPDDVYSRTIDWTRAIPGQSNPGRKHWKVIEEFDVDAGGTDR